MTATKTCGSCQLSKPVHDFSKLRSAIDGLQPTCKQCQSERWKKYKAARGDEIRQKQIEYHNRPEVKARKTELRTSESGRAKTRAYMAEYRKRNRAKLYEYERRYLDRKASNGGKFTKRDLEMLRAIYRNKCLACGGDDRLVADHVIPVSMGGSNGIENRQLLCHSCNSKKSNGTTDFRPQKN